MPMTEKKRKTDQAWKKKNLLTVGCKLYRGDAEKFKAYAAKNGKSVQELLREFVASCIGPLEKRTTDQDATASGQSAAEKE